MPDTFFGVQIALRVPQRHALRDGLAAAVRDLRERRDLPAQRAAWQRSGDLLRAEWQQFALGTWDLIREDPEQEYEQWASELEEIATWSDADFGSGGDLLLVTIIALIAGGSNADRVIGDLCDLPERDWHTRPTYRAMLGAMPMLNLVGVRGAGLYVAPHPDRPGFSLEVLRGEGFEYLEAVR
jgi:hypothetical protein